MSKEFQILKGDALTYVERVRTILMALDEFYEPYEAIRWFNSPQSLLSIAKSVDREPPQCLSTCASASTAGECDDIACRSS